jgi:2-polyprenyl-3-methyl-5-hydroxy-6-metoxy-1,4-benzoquinol methylase
MFKQKSNELLFASSMYEKEFEFRRCTRCGLIYHYPEPTSKELKKHYSNYGMSYEKKVFKSRFKRRKKQCLNIARKLSKYFDTIKPKVLDVGCSNGIMLKHMSDYGYDCYGVEVDPGASKIAKELFNEKRIFTGQLADSPFLDSSFDLVLCQQTIEHVPNPFEMLCQINKALKTSGTLFITTVNFGGLSFKLLKEKWKNTAVGDHISMFTVHTIEHYLRNAGFIVIKKKVIGFGFNDRRSSNRVYERFSNQYIKLFFRIIGVILRLFRKGDNIEIIAQKESVLKEKR